MTALRAAAIALVLLTAQTGSAHADDQTRLGAGDAAAIATAKASPLVRREQAAVAALAQGLADPRLRAATVDAVSNEATCIAHRAGLTAAGKAAVVAELERQGLIDAHEGARVPGGLAAGLFPPVVDDGGACPHLPQPFYAAPGGDEGGHHGWPGGLPGHTLFNARSGLDLAGRYGDELAPTGGTIDKDRVVAAALWHDWAKTLVFQWTADGGEFVELRLGGRGQTDDAGRPGDSRTGAHHILSLTEAMSRGLSPEQVIVQASAHAAPTGGGEYKLVNWLRTAAIIARVDPVARGYLRRDAAGTLRLALPGAADTVSADGGTPWAPERLIHHLSDGNWAFSVPAAQAADAALKAVAGRFGYDPGDRARYRTRFRTVVLARLGADAIQALNVKGGPDAVATAIQALRAEGAI